LTMTQKTKDIVYKIRILKDAVIILIITLALLILLELTLRMVFSDKLPQTLSSSAFEFNQDYLISLKPNIEKTFIRSEANGGDLIHWQTNNNSFRGAKLEDDPGTRIIVYGDSNIQARFSMDENTFPAKLEKYLSAAGVPDIEVINAGVVGFGPDQSLIRFRKEVDIYEPDLVVFHVFADNDFGDIVKNRLFEFDENSSLIETHHRRRADDNLEVSVHPLMLVRAAGRVARIIDSFFISESNEQEEMYNLLQQVVDGEYSNYKMKQDQEYSNFYDHYDLDIALDPNKESSQEKIRLMNAVIKAANSVALSRGIEFLILIQPSVIDLTKENAVLNYEYLENYPNYKSTNLTDAVENISVESDIHHINLYDTFLYNDPENLFFKDGNDHWNDQGQDIAAKESASYILDLLTER